MRKTLTVATMLLCVANPSRALELQGQHFGDDEIFSAVVKVFQKPPQHRFNPSAKSDPKPLLVLGPALKFEKKVNSKSFTHLTQQELVAQQQAVFLLVTKAHPDPERNVLYVYYDIPSNASWGILKVAPKDGKLVAEIHDSFRSSSCSPKGRLPRASLQTGTWALSTSPNPISVSHPLRRRFLMPTRTRSPNGSSPVQRSPCWCYLRTGLKWWSSARSSTRKMYE